MFLFNSSIASLRSFASRNKNANQTELTYNSIFFAHHAVIFTAPLLAYLSEYEFSKTVIACLGEDMCSSRCTLQNAKHISFNCKIFLNVQDSLGLEQNVVLPRVFPRLFSFRSTYRYRTYVELVLNKIHNHNLVFASTKPL